MKLIFDITVIGSGVVGLITALNLAQSTKNKILIVDKNKVQESWDQSIYDGRTYALNNKTIKILDELIFNWRDSVRYGVFDGIDVFGSSNKNNLKIINENSSGIIVENRELLYILYSKLKNFSNVKFLYGEIYSISNNSLCVNVDNIKYYIDSKIYLAADGKNSFIRNNLPISIKKWSYGQKAIVSTIYAKIEKNNLCFQSFTVNGPIAFLPLDKENYYSLVWSCSTDQADIIMSMEFECFIKELKKSIYFEVKEIDIRGPRFAFDLDMQHANTYFKGKFILLGDAAHTIHPLAGQGLNIGILDAIYISDMISAIDLSCAHQISLISRKYNRHRRFENRIYVAAMEFLHRSFTANKYVSSLTGAGMSLINKSPLLKESLSSFFQD